VEVYAEKLMAHACCADIVAMAWLYGNDQLDLSEFG